MCELGKSERTLTAKLKMILTPEHSVACELKLTPALLWTRRISCQVTQFYLSYRIQCCLKITFLVLPVLQLSQTCFSLLSAKGLFRMAPGTCQKRGSGLGWLSSLSSHIQSKKKPSQKQEKKSSTFPPSYFIKGHRF